MDDSNEKWVRHVGCECGSSDGMAVYEDGHGHCFVCGRHLPPGSFSDNDVARDDKNDTEDVCSWKKTTNELFETAQTIKARRQREGSGKLLSSGLIRMSRMGSLDARGIRLGTCRYFNYGSGTYKGRVVQIAEYTDDTGRVIAQKLRTKDKEFLTVGDFKKAGLFGQHLCQGGGKMLTITEGEIDAMAVWQSLGGRWPVVSLKNGAGVGSGAKKVARDLASQIDFLLKFDKIVLCFDMDQPGRDSAEAAAMMLPPGKAYIAVLPAGYKDACDMVKDNQEKGLLQAIFGAHAWRPDGVLSLIDPVVLEKAIKIPTIGYKYPWSGLNDRVFGLHPGQIHVLGAGSGTGKSVACAEIAVNFCKQGLKVAYIALEENVAMTAQRLAGIVLNHPLYLPGGAEGVTSEQIKEALIEIGKDDRLFLYDHFGSLDTDVLFSRLRYLSSHLGVQIVILDHISIIISGNEDNDNERRMIDVLMTRLRSFCEETQIAMVVVTHLSRRQGVPYEEGASVTIASFRGSGAIGQLADAAFGLERDQQADDPDQRDLTRVRVVKSRLGGRTGEACTLRYHHTTGRLLDIIGELDNEAIGTRNTKQDDY